MKYNLDPKTTTSLSEEEKYELLMNLETLHLDWVNISTFLNLIIREYR